MILKPVTIKDPSTDLNGQIVLNNLSNNKPEIQYKKENVYFSAGSLPNTVNIRNYYTKERSHLDTNFLMSLFENSYIGFNKAKLNDFQVLLNSSGKSQFLNIEKQTITEKEVDLENNEIPLEFVEPLNNWLFDRGYNPSPPDQTFIDSVRVQHNGKRHTYINSLVFNTLKIGQPIEGGQETDNALERVYNLWTSIDNTRHNKTLPADTNLGSTVIVTKFPSYQDSGEQLYFQEIKVRVQAIDYSGNVFIYTLDLFVKDYKSSEISLASVKGTEGNKIQVVGSNQGTSSKPVYGVRVVWDKNIYELANIIDICLYENN